MKLLLTLGLLAATWSLVPAASAAPHSTSHATVRPLVRYLTATLHLRPRAARRVQRAVLHAPLALRTPEQVAERLRPVLSADQFEHYGHLQNDVVAYEQLQRLAAQH
ncbi:MAG: hypothetical protein ACRYFK_12090 [Janthinobacterium lividum]